MAKFKENYTIVLRCATCGSDDHFEFNDDKSYVKCTMCNREYLGGIEELKNLNEEAIEETKEQFAKDAKSYLQKELLKVFKKNKHIKIMGFVEWFREWGGQTLSVCSIIGGLFAYFRHDNKRELGTIRFDNTSQWKTRRAYRFM